MAFAALFADSLFCSEERLDDLFQEPAQDDHWPPAQPPAPQQQPALDDELPALFEAYRRKEEPLPDHGERYGGNAGREAAVGWATRAAARLGFSALTAALATAYLDRCFLGLSGGAGAGGAMRLGEQPWKARLAAVACVALAAKVEETRVPLLLDLQLLAAGPDPDAAAYVFDSDTMYRMEAIVLNELAWRMHPVTPFSFLHPVLAAARLRHCEGVLLAVMADWRWPRYRPSAWAAAALCVTAAFGTDDADADLLALINAPEDEVAECAKILTGEAGFVLDNKRKRSPPLSPIGVIGSAAYFSRESSTSSADVVTTAWPGCVSVSSSPDPAGRPLKRATSGTMLPPDEESRDAWP
ncbi:hypothetical protein QYE76_003930 [Lolium multiflorum]|uniref:Cyclin N-terminal domain-containing protein n=1 Tax=Lolium multiflorum TaxID=4521 RepID=A0AAD8RQ79_LOLMU|nr:hypothetical protein QYE76_003930 [Lolium multiflorum]